MTKTNKLLLTAAGMAMALSLATHAQAKDPGERAQKVFKHWTVDRIANAEPRDMVIDHRGKAYIKGKNGNMTPHGHSVRAEAAQNGKKEPRAKPPWAGGGGGRRLAATATLLPIHAGQPAALFKPQQGAFFMKCQTMAAGQLMSVQEQ